MTSRAELFQDGVLVAEVDARTDAEAEREIMHYAMMYAQDGPVVVKFPKGSELQLSKPEAKP